MSLPPSYFEELYAGSPDPWGFTERWYERRKYAITLASLPEPRYRSAFEPGCSIGLLTEQLATRCTRLLAADAAEGALATARERLAGHPNVTVERRVLPGDWPDGRFDLIVLGELGYYLSRGDLARLVELATGSLEPGGTLLAVHWRHPVDDYPLRGDDVHDALAAAPGLSRTARHLEDDFVLDVLVCDGGGPRSVAARTGLVPDDTPDQR